MTGAWAWLHDFFEIVGGIAAAVAVGFSVWVTTRERADRKQAERDRDEAREAQRRAELAERKRAREAQARRVVVTATATWVGPLDDQAQQWRCRWRNYSDMPIADADVFVKKSRLAANDFDGAISGSSRAILRPEDAEQVVTFLAEKGSAFKRSDISLHFRDAAGVYWRRGADGALDELAAPEVDAST